MTYLDKFNNDSNRPPSGSVYERLWNIEHGMAGLERIRWMGCIQVDSPAGFMQVLDDSFDECLWRG